MDAVMASDKGGNWVRIQSSPKDQEENPFWSSSEKKPKKLQEKTKTAQSANSPDMESSRGTPNITRKERVR